MTLPATTGKLDCWTFSVIGPMAWNSLPDNLCDPMLSDDKFRAALKTHFSPKYQNM